MTLIPVSIYGSGDGSSLLRQQWFFLYQLKTQMGLDDPAIIQYFRWLVSMLQGNLGISYRNSLPVLGQDPNRKLQVLVPTGNEVREEVLEDFEKAANGYGFTLKSSKLSAPAYVSPNHPYIPVLCGICDYVQEKHYEPYTMGGGTYSRHLPLAVGFGPGIPEALPIRLKLVMDRDSYCSLREQ